MADFLYNSDDNIDKVIFFKEVVLEAYGATGDSAVVAHGLGFAPLTFGVYSPSPSFSPSEAVNIFRADDYVICSADSQNIRVFNLTAARVYVRVFGLMPTTQNGDAPEISQGITGFKFSSDYNYTKLYMAGSIEQQTSGEMIINHNLGYIPQAMVWSEDSGVIAIMTDAAYIQDRNVGANVYSEGVVLTDTQLKIYATGGPFVHDRYHYRIYRDEQS